MMNVLPTLVKTVALVRIWSTAIHVLALLATLESAAKATMMNVLPTLAPTELLAKIRSMVSLVLV